jgi:DNA-binding transcriptional ArsR family regulator
MKPTDLVELKANATMMAARLKVMSHPERLLMLCRMDEGEVSVNELVAMTGLSQSGVSQHLALLRTENIVNVRIEAQTRWYSLKDRIVSGTIHALCALYEAEKALIQQHLPPPPLP